MDINWEHAESPERSLGDHPESWIRSVDNFSGRCYRAGHSMPAQPRYVYPLCWDLGFRPLTFHRIKSCGLHTTRLKDSFHSDFLWLHTSHGDDLLLSRQGEDTRAHEIIWNRIMVGSCGLPEDLSKKTTRVVSNKFQVPKQRTANNLGIDWPPKLVGYTPTSVVIFSTSYNISCPYRNRQKWRLLRFISRLVSAW